MTCDHPHKRRITPWANEVNQMKRNYHYPDNASIEDIDSVLVLSAKVLDTDKVVIKDKTMIPPLVGATLDCGLAAGGVAGPAAAGFSGGVVVAAVISYFVFRSKKKKLSNMRLARYTEAVKIQNKTIAKLIEIDKVREQKEKALRSKIADYAQEVSGLRSKINELRAINESLLEIINNLQEDLELDKAA
jgi:hypothetical protein